MRINKFIYIILFTVTILTFSCEQEGLDPILVTEDGAGTLSSYKAYTISSEAGSDVIGRVVFWESIDGMTLIQVSLDSIELDTSVSESFNYRVSVNEGTVLSPGPAEFTSSISWTRDVLAYDWEDDEDDASVTSFPSEDYITISGSIIDALDTDRTLNFDTGYITLNTDVPEASDGYYVDTVFVTHYLHYAEFSNLKLDVFSADTDFFSTLDDYDAHISITDAAGDIVASGNIGANAVPVDEN